MPWLRKNSISKLMELNKNKQPTQEMIYGILVLSSVFKNFSNLGVKTDY